MRNFNTGQTKLEAKFDLVLEKVKMPILFKIIHGSLKIKMLNCNNNLSLSLSLSLTRIQIDNLSYELAVDHKVLDIDAYLPFKTVAGIEEFCSPADGLLDLKKAAFRKRIYAASNKKDLSAFAPSIIDAFFDGSPLLGTHKWPYKK